MSILVNPRNEREEQELLAFLEHKNYDYTKEETLTLSEAQQQEILERDRQYEAGETEAYTFEEFLSHFDISKK